MPPFLSKRFAGLPTWAWLAIVAGGLSIGLILRYRQQQQAQDTTDPETGDTTTDPYGDQSGAYPDYSSDPGFAPNAVDTLGSGGYVNYPIQPIQPGINVTVGGNQPCDEKTKPKQHRQGYQWVCINGNWQQRPMQRPPGSGHHHGHHQGGHHHHHHPPQRHGSRSASIRTGGGPPATRRNHEPLGGMPRGQSTDSRMTWVPGNPSLLVPTS